MNDLELDVRPLLRDGGEPFGAIMDAVNRLEPGQRLKLFATFRPEPLFSVMQAKGFGYDETPLDHGEWQVVFTPQAENVLTGASVPEDPDSWDDPVHYLELSDLDPPEPMVRILTQLETMSEGEVLFALLGREPLLLFPELGARGHAWAGDFDAAGEHYRLMVRAGRRP